MNAYRVRPLHKDGATLSFRVPASKSILNRALLLSALSPAAVRLAGGNALGEDTRAFLRALGQLGIPVRADGDDLIVTGCGGTFPVRSATIDVQSAGTAARFLPVALAFSGGEFLLNASEQMRRRPMREELSLLRQAGASVECLGKEDAFPFLLRSRGIHARKIAVNTDASSQYASAFLLAAGAGNRPLSVTLTGSRTNGSYLALTLKMLRAFGVSWERIDDTVTVFPQTTPPARFIVEPDLSGACYFYALALLFPVRVLVQGVREDSVQGDRKFLQLLKDRGVRFEQREEGLLADGTAVDSFAGFDEDMKDYSDQALTVAALAPFAAGPTVIRNVGHIRLQECDRMRAVTENLNAIGVPARAEGDDIFISPAPVTGGRIRTFGDHRVAMAFTLTGLKTGTLEIDDPACCSKTFEGFFDLISQLTE